MSPQESHRLIIHRRMMALIISVALILITFLVHRAALDGAWRGDDMQQLISAKDHSLFQLFFQPKAWRTFTAYFFTPIQALQFQLDVWLFNYNPRNFFLHNLTNLAATIILTYHFLARRSPPLLSFLACTGILLSMPVFGTTTFFYACHYITGLFFAIASVWLHQNAHRSHMTRNLLASGAMFFLALMSKEIYAMVLVYFLLRSWRSPAFLKSLLIYPMLTAIFFLWRWKMLGDPVGGYAADISLLDRVRALACVHRTILGGDINAVLGLVIAGAVAIYHRLLNWRRLACFAIGAIVAYLPLLFATVMIQIVWVSALRYAFFPVWLFFAGMTHLATPLWEQRHKKTAGAILLGAIGMTLWSSIHQVGDFRNSLKEGDVQANFIREGGPRSAIFTTPAISQIDGNIYRQLARLGGREPVNIIASQDDIQSGIDTYWGYDPHDRRMIRYSPDQVQEKLAGIPHFPPDNAPIALLAIWQSDHGDLSFMSLPNLASTCQATFPGVITDCAIYGKFFMAMMMPIPSERMDFSRVRVHRIRSDGQASATPALEVPWTGTVQWNRGVFLPAESQTPMRKTTCRLDAPLRKEIRLKSAEPLEIHGWIQLPAESRPDLLPLAFLEGSDGKRYATNLYRMSRKSLAEDTTQTMIEAQVLDADFEKVAPGSYRLVLGTENASCDIGTTLIVESP